MPGTAYIVTCQRCQIYPGKFDNAGRSAAPTKPGRPSAFAPNFGVPILSFLRELRLGPHMVWNVYRQSVVIIGIFMIDGPLVDWLASHEAVHFYSIRCYHSHQFTQVNEVQLCGSGGGVLHPGSCLDGQQDYDWGRRVIGGEAEQPQCWR